MGLTDFTVPTAVYWGFGSIALAFVLLFIFAKALGGGQIIRVPDGVPVDRHFRQWKSRALSKRVGRGAIFLAFLAVGLLLGGCGAVIVGVVT